MKRVLRGVDVVCDIFGSFAGWLVLLLMSLVLIEVIARYVFNSPLRLADEIGGYLLIAVAFIGAGYTWKEGGHISIEFIIDRLPPKPRKWLDLVTLVIAAALVLVLINATYDLVVASLEKGTKSLGILRAPLAFPQIPMVVGCIVLMFAVIADLVKTIRAARTSAGGQNNEL